MLPLFHENDTVPPKGHYPNTLLSWADQLAKIHVVKSMELWVGIIVGCEFNRFWFIPSFAQQRGPPHNGKLPGLLFSRSAAAPTMETEQPLGTLMGEVIFQSFLVLESGLRDSMISR